MIAKVINDRSKKWARVSGFAAAALLAGCGASMDTPYPALGTQPNIWITYPTPGNTNICLSSDTARSFPVYFTAYNQPTGTQVKVTLDPQAPGGGKQVALTNTSPAVIPMAAETTPTGEHRIAVEIVNVKSDGTTTPLTADQTKNYAAAKFFVTFSTKARTEVVAGTAAAAAARCPKVVQCTADTQCDPADPDAGTGAQTCVDGVCTTPDA